MDKSVIAIRSDIEEVKKPLTLNDLNIRISGNPDLPGYLLAHKPFEVVMVIELKGIGEIEIPNYIFIGILLEAIEADVPWFDYIGSTDYDRKRFIVERVIKEMGYKNYEQLMIEG